MSIGRRVVPRKPKLGSIYRRGDVWWLKYYRGGKPFRESSKSDIYADAERMLKRRHGEIVTGKFAGLEPERITVRQLIDLVKQDYRENGKASLNDVTCRAKLHLLPEFGDVRVAEFGTQHVRRYIAGRQRDKAANATINRELAILKRAFTLGFRNDPPLVARTVYISTLAENNVRVGFLDHDGYVKLRDELPDPIRPLFVVGYHTGARLGEPAGFALAASGPQGQTHCARSRHHQEQRGPHLTHLWRNARLAFDAGNHSTSAVRGLRVRVPTWRPQDRRVL